MDRTIAAGIVLFNPDNIERVIKCIEMVHTQVEHVYIYDNSTKKIDLLLPERVTYITESRNVGVAYALNRIMEQAKKDGYSWVLTMDQDSVLPEGIVKDFSRYVECDYNIGIICPQVIDKRRAYMNVDVNDGVEYLDMCITSASCTSISAWETVGKFDEWLFVDLVDNEFCKRLVESGYKILQVKKWVLDQEFGKIIPKSKEKQEFWISVSQLLRNENFAKFSYKKSISPFRVYYTCRNIIYVNRKMKYYGATAYENYNCKGYWGFIIAFVVPSFLRADKRMQVFKEIFRGTCDGLKKDVDPWIAQNKVCQGSKI